MAITYKSLSYHWFCLLIISLRISKFLSRHFSISGTIKYLRCFDVRFSFYLCVTFTWLSVRNYRNTSKRFLGLRSMEFQFLEVYCCYSEEVKHYCFHKVSQWSPSTFSERHEGHNGWLALRETHFDEGD